MLCFKYVLYSTKHIILLIILFIYYVKRGYSRYTKEASSVLLLFQQIVKDFRKNTLLYN